MKDIFRILSKLLILIAVTLSSSCFVSGQTVKYYVSTTGDDTNKGTVEQPFATLQAAQNAIRSAKIKGLDVPVEVILRGGVYYLEKTLELKPEDSGKKEAPITWRAAENERVILSGGKQISGNWKKDSGGKTWYIDLPESKSWERNVNEPELYQNKPAGPWHFRQLFVEEGRATRARFPNKNEKNPFLYALDGSMRHVQLADGLVKPDWGEEHDAQVNMIPNWRFFNQWNDVIGVDSEKSEIYFVNFKGIEFRHTTFTQGHIEAREETLLSLMKFTIACKQLSMGHAFILLQ